VEIDALADRGLTQTAISEHLNDAGYRTSRGHPWTPSAVFHWTSRRTRRRDLQELHRRLLAQAKSRGLSNAQTADEFNGLGIARVGGKPWTANTVRQRRVHLNRASRLRSGVSSSCA